MSLPTEAHPPGEA